MKTSIEDLQKIFKKLVWRFQNYHNSKKWFVVFLGVLTVFLLFPPLIRITKLQDASEVSYSLLFSFSYLRSLVVILISLGFLIGWNVSIKFKRMIMNFFSFRENEPLVDFALLWVITSVFMGIVDTVGVTTANYGSIRLTNWAIFDQLLLLGGLVWSFVTLWKSEQRTSRQTKIVRIVDTPQRSDSDTDKKELSDPSVRHLFDHLDEEE